MKVVTVIELGNEAMRDGSDLARALRQLADRVDGLGVLGGGEIVPVSDLNGNRVGDLEVTA